MRRIYVITILLLFLSVNTVYAKIRLKDISYIKGVRENQIYGYGLVIGLNGTGDRQSSFPTLQTVGNLLRKLGISISPGEVASKLRTRNIAAVIVTAKLTPLVKPGTKIDVLVSSIGDATSLEAGVLLQTPLQGADGEIYAVAQGSLSTGLGVSGGMRRGAPLTVARVPEGALVEKEVTSTLVRADNISIILKQPDFTTAARIVNGINNIFSSNPAFASDAGIIHVKVPDDFKNNLVGFIAQIENVSVEPDSRAKIVINERTGTIVAGKDVRISTVAVSHGNVSVQINYRHELTRATVQARSYPPKGELISDTESTVITGEGTTRMELVEESVSVYELVKALNALGVAPKDLIAILQAIKEVGALSADLELI